MLRLLFAASIALSIDLYYSVCCTPSPRVVTSQGDRVAYLCTKQAKVVAMTCTHAALKRREFLNLGLKYDNVVMEEAGQVC